MRYLGLDVGTKTVGISISDKTNLIVSPLKTFRFKEINEAVAEITELINSNEITDIVIGLPKNMDGTEGFAADRSKDFARLLKEKIDKEIHFVDERLTTVEAENILIERNYSREKRKEVIDGVAAVLILETYLKMKGD